MPPAPLVRAVVVSYEGGELTLECLRSLRDTAWSSDALEIVLVDNASPDGSADAVERELPEVRVIRSQTNRGFAGGCNLGFQDLGETAYVAIVNNDAAVEPEWLQPLVDALADDPALGAACPKILLSGMSRELTLHAPTARRAGRDVGVWVSGARVDGVGVWPRTQLVHGWWGLEPPGRGWPPGQWSRDEALLRIPVGDGEPETVELQVTAPSATTITVSSGDESRAVDVGPERTWITVPLPPPSVTVVNNVGSVLTEDRHGADRGLLELDDGRFDEPEDVFAWCGAGVLLRREYLDDVGPMDERLFLYYEDFEHAWRGRDRGWRYRTVPESVVHHVHAATTVEGSPLKLYHEERNRLLVLTRHATASDAWRAVLRHPLVTASYLRRDVLGRIVRGRTPSGRVVGPRIRAFGGFLRRVPGALRSRRADRRRRK